MTHRRQVDQTGTPIPPDLIASMVSPKRVEDFIDAQSELFRHFQHATHCWLERVHAEAELFSELSSKLAAARTLPETTTLVQECTKRQMEIFAEESKRLMEDGQKFMELTARVLSKSWLPNGKDGSS